MANDLKEQFPTNESIVAFLKQILGTYATDFTAIDENQGFMALGLDSLEILDMAMMIEEKIGVQVSQEQLFEFNTISSLAHFLFSSLHPNESTPSNVAQMPSEKKYERSALLNTEVAIVGLGCRFPGGINSPDDLWQVLIQGEDALDRPAPNRKVYREPLGGFLENIEYFDAKHFGISPREAIYIDPQQRIVLEVIWDALKQAQITPESLRGTNTGVYLGITNNDYLRHLNQSDLSHNLFYSTGNALSVASGRISYLLGLNGPCMSLDTACSSSLVALHLACEAIRKGECDLAIVAGVNLILDPTHTNNLIAAGMLSPEGRCKSFDASANGFVRSEGFGVIIVARPDINYQPLAFIKGSAINQDGQSTGLSAPNIKAQQEVLNAALHDAGIHVDEVDYIEAHGSATTVGDSIELNAIQRVYTPRKYPLFIGSIKAAIGHTEATAGIAGVIKTVLALIHQQLPPQPHFHHKSKQCQLIDEEATIVQSLQSWPRSTRRRIAGVSSFGFSGTNCHMIIAEHTEEINPPVFSPIAYQREYFWPKTHQHVAIPAMIVFNHPLLHHKLRLASSEVLYLGELSLAQFPYLLGHDIFSHVLFPGAAFYELFMAVAQDYCNKQAFTIEQFRLNQALILRPEDKIQIQLLLKDEQLVFYAKHAKSDEWIGYAQAILKPMSQEVSFNINDGFKPIPQAAQIFYEFMNANKIHYGKEFQVIEQVSLNDGQIRATLKVAMPKSDFLIHPTLLDGCFQVPVTWAVLHQMIKPAEAYLPLSIEKGQFFMPIPEQIIVIAEVLTQSSAETMQAHLKLTDLQGNTIAIISGLQGKRANIEAIERQLNVVGDKKEMSSTVYLSERLAHTPKKRQAKVIRDFVAEEIRRVLKLDALADVPMDTGFFDMGMDSLMLVELQQNIQQSVNTLFELNPTAGFDYPSPSALAEKITAEWILVQKEESTSVKQDAEELSVSELIMKIDND